MPVYFNIENSLYDIFRKELSDFGYNCNEKISYYYFLISKRLLKKKKRNIRIAKDFICPPENEKGLEIFKQKIRDGENLNPYLPKEIDKLDYQDGMLYAWNIYHFHLGERMEPNGRFIQRTGNILYAFIDETSSNIYFLNVLPHGHWGDFNLIETISANWKHLLCKTKLNPNEKLEQLNISDKDRIFFRKKGINVLEQIDDAIVFPTNGVVSTGDSFEVMQYVTKLNRDIHNIKKKITSEIGNCSKDYIFECEKKGREIFIKDKYGKYEIEWIRLDFSKEDYY